MKLIISNLLTCIIAIVGIFSDKNPKLQVLLVVLILIASIFAIAISYINEQDAKFLKEQVRNHTYALGIPRHVHEKLVKAVEEVTGREIEYHYEVDIYYRETSQLPIIQQVLQGIDDYSILPTYTYKQVESFPGTKALLGFSHFGKVELIELSLLGKRQLKKAIKDKLIKKWDTNEIQEISDLGMCSFKENFDEIVAFFFSRYTNIKYRFGDFEFKGNELIYTCDCIAEDKKYKFTIPNKALVNILNESRIFAGGELIKTLKEMFNIEKDL